MKVAVEIEIELPAWEKLQVFIDELEEYLKEKYREKSITVLVVKLSRLIDKEE